MGRRLLGLAVGVVFLTCTVFTTCSLAFAGRFLNIKDMNDGGLIRMRGYNAKKDDDATPNEC